MIMISSVCVAKVSVKTAHKYSYWNGVLSIKGTSNFPAFIFSSGEEQLILRTDKVLLKELRAVAGLYIRIKGRISRETKDLKSIWVDSYSLLPTDEFTASAIGIVSKEGVFLDRATEKEFILQKIPTSFLEKNDGALIWVLGNLKDERIIKVERYGVIKRDV